MSVPIFFYPIMAASLSNFTSLSWPLLPPPRRTCKIWIRAGYVSSIWVLCIPAREGRTKERHPFLSFHICLFIHTYPPLHWPTLPLWLSRPHSPFTTYHKDKGRLVKWLKAWVLSQSRPELNFWSCILFFCKTRQSVSSLSVYLWNRDLVQIIWNKVFANKFPKYNKSLKFTLKFSFQRSAV